MLELLLSVDHEWSPSRERTRASLSKKLREAATAPAGVNVGPLEEALEKAAMGKVVRLEGGHGTASRMAANVKATVADAEILGAWLARQGWMNEPMTLLAVLRKWNEWLPRARATEPPPALASGLGIHGRGQTKGASGVQGRLVSKDQGPPGQATTPEGEPGSAPEDCQGPSNRKALTGSRQGHQRLPAGFR